MLYIPHILVTFLFPSTIQTSTSENALLIKTTPKHEGISNANNTFIKCILPQMTRYNTVYERYRPSSYELMFSRDLSKSWNWARVGQTTDIFPPFRTAILKLETTAQLKIIPSANCICHSVWDNREDSNYSTQSTLWWAASGISCPSIASHLVFCIGMACHKDPWRM